ncbi:hypothetical protein B0H11DRAFT_2253265 [Mycena galericulata]|nr:hypothetical protein B0H11DRAFT_2253265 [Mycena galericulata]
MRTAPALGPYDGRVAAHVWVKNNHCFITTNARYIPAFPPGVENELYLRRDMRWGPDDPTLWPHEYSDYYSHFGAIPRRPSTEKGKSTLGIMFWDPTRADFVEPNSQKTLTRGLGKLSSDKVSLLSPLVHDLIKKCEDYTKSLRPPAQPLPLIPALTYNLHRGLVRLSIPATFERMVLGVTKVQRTYLELTGLLDYMTVYKPRMENPASQGGLPDADTVGVFTASPIIAENFHRARLPFWFIRPLSAFFEENILRVVRRLEPEEWMELEVYEGFTPIAVGPTVQERIHALIQGTETLPWYKNPFARGDEHKPLEMTSIVGGSSAAGPSVAMSRPNSRNTVAGGSRDKSRSNPYSRPDRKVPNPNAEQERDKYQVFVSPYMAPTIPSWAAALAAVDRSQPSACGADPVNLYVFPEPALLISSASRLDMYLHHYQLIRDALLYRMGDRDDLQAALKVSEWRDILQGKVVKQGKRGSLAEKRTTAIEQVLGPAMRACGIDKYDGFPVDPKLVQETTHTRGKEITWELAEMNFRFELCTLDGRASGLERPDECMKCFPGGLIGPELSEGKKGFAAIASSERLPYLLSLARLMLDWSYRPRPESLETAGATADWNSNLISDLETKVARYYTQTFYHFFGRAAVIPMRLEHELGTGTVTNH